MVFQEQEIPRAPELEGEQEFPESQDVDDQLMFHMEGERPSPPPSTTPTISQPPSLQEVLISFLSPWLSLIQEYFLTTFPYHLQRQSVRISHLSALPGAHVEKFLGRISLFFIKESWAINEGGLGGFCHGFINEAQGIARAHVLSLVEFSLFHSLSLSLFFFFFFFI